METVVILPCQNRSRTTTQNTFREILSEILLFLLLLFFFSFSRCVRSGKMCVRHTHAHSTPFALSVVKSNFPVSAWPRSNSLFFVSNFLFWENPQNSPIIALSSILRRIFFFSMKFSVHVNGGPKGNFGLEKKSSKSCLEWLWAGGRVKVRFLDEILTQKNCVDRRMISSWFQRDAWELQMIFFLFVAP